MASTNVMTENLKSKVLDTSFGLIKSFAGGDERTDQLISFDGFLQLFKLHL